MALAPTVAALTRAGDGTVAGALQWLTGARFTAVQLDATLPGIRPRELGPRARRDLVALAARRDIRLGGVDLMLPRGHYTDPVHQDRAMGATLAGIELAADLGRLPLSLTLPADGLPDDLRSALVTAADGHGIRLAVHAEDQLDALVAWVEQVDLPALGIGLDPAGLLARSEDAAEAAQRLGRRLAVGRLCDLSMPSATRRTVGDGDLDVAAYRVALDLAPARTGPVVLDLRGVEQPFDAACAGRTAWDGAAFTI